MSSIVKQKVGSNIYLYESVSYRNDQGKPRNRRVPIGKIDPETGNPVFKLEYIERMARNNTPVEVHSSQKIFSKDDVRSSSIKEFGAFFLLNRIAQEMGLLQSIQESSPSNWRELFLLACYLVTTGNPFSYCEGWISNTECIPAKEMSSQRISDLLAAVSSKEREAFFQAWCNLRSEKEYLALDITSVSSYSKLISDIEWGYNRDGEQLPQVNLCMLMGEKSRLPIYQTLYSGSLKDVSSLKTTLSKMDAISGGKPLLIVMDKGFFSAKNINTMLSSDGLRFVTAVPFSASFAKNQVISECKSIDCIENTFVLGSDSIRGITKLRSWNRNCKVFVHIYYNAVRAMKAREELYAHVSLLKDSAKKDPATAMLQDECKKYLLIRQSKKAATGYTVKIRTDVINNELKHAGWMILISNHINDTKEALRIYREKDVVEKGFMRLKNCLDLSRLRVHHENSMQNKTFVGFIALILLSQIHKVMLDKELYKQMTMRKLLMTLSKLRVQTINGDRIMFPLTKEQKGIYKAFEIEEPV